MNQRVPVDLGLSVSNGGCRSDAVSVAHHQIFVAMPVLDDAAVTRVLVSGDHLGPALVLRHLDDRSVLHMPGSCADRPLLFVLRCGEVKPHLALAYQIHFIPLLPNIRAGSALGNRKNLYSLGIVLRSRAWFCYLFPGQSSQSPHGPSQRFSFVTLHLKQVATIFPPRQRPVLQRVHTMPHMADPRSLDPSPSGVCRLPAYPPCRRTHRLPAAYLVCARGRNKRNEKHHSARASLCRAEDIS